MSIRCSLMGHVFSKRFLFNTGLDYLVCNHCGKSFRLYRDQDFEEMCEEHKWEEVFWDSRAWFEIKFWAGIILMLCMVIALIIVPVSLADKAKCTSHARLGIPTEWQFWISCMAKHPEFGWIPVDRYFEIANLYVK